MSADVYVQAQVCEWSDVAHANATYNLGPMLRAAGMKWSDFEDAEKGGPDAVPALLSKINDTLTVLRAERGRFLPLNPPNGWGTYEGLVEFLERIRTAILEHPGCRIRTWL